MIALQARVRCPSCSKSWSLEYVDQGGGAAGACATVKCIHGCGVSPVPTQGEING